MKRVLAVMLGIIIVLATLTISSADTYYSDTYLHTPLNAGYTPEGINNAGTIVGYYNDGTLPIKNHGFILSGGSTYLPLDFPGSASTNCTHINDAGTIVGYYRDTQGYYHGFIQLNGASPTSLNYPGAKNTYAQGINNNGTIVGWWEDNNGRRYGFMWDSSPHTLDFNANNIRATLAFGINDSGKVVGWWEDINSVGHGFTWSSTDGYSSFDYPGVPYTHAYGINNAGTIVGSFAFYNNTMKGFTLNKGIYAPNSAIYAFGINNSGSIVGTSGTLGAGDLLTGYNAEMMTVANVDNVSDTFTVWLKATQTKDGSIVTTGCTGVLKILTADGRVATQTKCEFLNSINGEHRFTMQIAKDAQDNKRSRYIENASFYICQTMGSSASDLPACSLVNGTPPNFSVYGSTFDIGKHAWKFRNGAWDLTPGQPSKTTSPEWVFHNNFYKAASVMQSYLKNSTIHEFWEDIGYASYNGSNGSLIYSHKSVGQCYGLAAAAIANYTHQEDAEAWGIDTFTKTGWNTDIINRWADPAKATSTFGVLAPGADIFNAPDLNDQVTIWSIDAAKKIMYHYVSQPYFLGGQNWAGKDTISQITRLDTNSETAFINILKGGAPVSLSIAHLPKFFHHVAVPQMIVYDDIRNFMIWNNNFPLHFFSSSEGPYEYLSLLKSQYEGWSHNVYTIDVEEGWPLDVMMLTDGILYTPLGCGDSQNIYNQWTAPCVTSQSAMAQDAATDIVDYQYPDHITVLVIGAQVDSVHDQTTNSSVTLIPNGDIISGQAVKTVSSNGLFASLYLPATDTYQIQAMKYAGFTGLKVLVTIPNANGTAQMLNYDNLSTGDADATQITFTVGRGNPNTGIGRTIAGDTYNPDYNASLATVLPPPADLQATVSNDGTAVALSWTNTSNPLFASVLVIRKAGSVPSSSIDGILVYSGTGQSTLDTVTAGTVYYYAAYSSDSLGNLSAPIIRQIDTGLKSVYGTIGLTSGGGLANANLQLIDVDNKVIGSATSSADGTYAISNITNGSYTLKASHATAIVTPASSAITISGSSQKVDLSATNQKTLFLLFDSFSFS